MSLRTKIGYLARLILPPALFMWGKSRRKFPFDGIYNSFKDIPVEVGYESDGSLRNLRSEVEHLLEHLLSDKRLAQAHARSQIANLLPLLLAAKANEGKQVRVIDFGGGGQEAHF